MLTVISGNDQVGILNFIKSKKESFQGQEIFDTNERSYLPTEIEDISNSVDMFASKKLIIIKANFVSNVDFSERFLTSISKRNDVEILIDASKLIKTTKIYKLLAKFGNKMVFDQKRNYDVYNISDAYLAGNKHRAIELLLNFYNTDDDFYNVLSTIHFGLRNLVAKSEKNKAWNTLHPFVKKKLASVNIEIGHLKIIYKNLFEIDAKSKSISEKRINLLLDFMLESSL